MAEYGKGSPLKALQAWTTASDLGHAEAPYRIGVLYSRGEGVTRNAPEAVSWYRRAAEAGYVDAQFQLGLIYLNGVRTSPASAGQESLCSNELLEALFPQGISVEQDSVQALHWLRTAASGGKAEAYAVLGDMLCAGLGCAANHTEARRYYEAAAQNGVAAGEAGLGDLHYNGLGVPVDLAAAAGWYREAAEKGDPRAQVALALMSLNGRGRPADREEAGRLFVLAAEQGDPRGLHHAALLYMTGDGLPENLSKAETYLREAAKRDHLPSVIALGEFYARGKGAAPDLQEASAWYQRAAELGDASAQFILGGLYATGTGFVQNLREAARWFLCAAEQGHASAAHNIAVLYAKGAPFGRDIAKAVEWYEVAAQAGLAAAQLHLGRLHAAGDGVPRDWRAAAEWLGKAAASGDPEAKTALAMLHLHGGEGVHDPIRAENLLREAAGAYDTGAALQLGHLLRGNGRIADAMEWYRRAGEAGDFEAQFALGAVYIEGRGCERDVHAAIYWFEKAANAGHAPSQFQLGVLFSAGQGIKLDHSRALYWYERAAKLGHWLAQYNFGVMLSKGQGCTADREKALSWFRLAAEQGLPEAQFVLKDAYLGGDGGSNNGQAVCRWSREAHQAGKPRTLELQNRAQGEDSTPGPARPFPFEVTRTGAHHLADLRKVEHFVDLDRIGLLARRGGLAVFAIHCEGASLQTFHLEMIEALRSKGYAICVVNSFSENDALLAAHLRDKVHTFISRGDYGRDFGSWVSALVTLDGLVQAADHVLLINDSIIGPVRSLDHLFQRFKASIGDIFGLSDSYQHHYHLQSSVLFIRRSAFSTPEFHRFFQEYSYPNDKTNVILLGEVALSAYGLDAGLTLDVMCPYESVVEHWLGQYESDLELVQSMPEFRHGFPQVIDGVQTLSYGYAQHTKIWYFNTAGDIRAQVARNAQHSFWNTLINDFDYPFLKRELVTKNPEGVANLFLLGSVIDPTFKDLLSIQMREALRSFPGKGPLVMLNDVRPLPGQPRAGTLLRPANLQLVDGGSQ
ncbi:rhamnan synthesis F family protein [Mesorhizobium sp. VK4C]|uniref:rhamnan synthesis F family protein n=1 Tax=Mesorhizobium captivum TaxID=3072319 RepID=UPI002A2476A4|nr:rhamnan synthesis F family protein [Mesorhizobium sp. VK4C]MDX8500845.1 rhamnan synthesis F family protein [Mesorhizobium sp. VK4C]